VTPGLPGPGPRWEELAARALAPPPAARSRAPPSTTSAWMITWSRPSWPGPGAHRAAKRGAQPPGRASGADHGHGLSWRVLLAQLRS